MDCLDIQIPQCEVIVLNSFWTVNDLPLSDNEKIDARFTCALCFARTKIKWSVNNW